jgi:hypothetical protein
MINLEFQQQQLNIKDWLAGTGLIVFPYAIMQRNYILAGSDIRLQFPNGVQAIFKVGTALGKDDFSGEREVLIDGEYYRAYSDLDPQDTIGISDITKPIAEVTDLIFLVSSESALAKIKNWLDYRKVINLNARYRINGAEFILLEHSAEDMPMPFPAAIDNNKFSNFKTFVLDSFDDWTTRWVEHKEAILRLKLVKESYYDEVNDFADLRSTLQGLHRDIANINKQADKLIAFIEQMCELERYVTQDMLKKIALQQNQYATRVAGRGENERVTLRSGMTLPVFQINSELLRIYDISRLAAKQEAAEDYEDPQASRQLYAVKNAAEKAIEGLSVPSLPAAPDESMQPAKTLEAESERLVLLAAIYKNDTVALIELKDSLAGNVHSLSSKYAGLLGAFSAAKQFYDQKETHLNGMVKELTGRINRLPATASAGVRLQNNISVFFKSKTAAEVQENAKELRAILMHMATSITEAHEYLA